MPTRLRIARTTSSTNRARFSSGPPVLVLAIVDRRAQELRDQVAVGAVQLDAVEPGLARPPRAFGKRVDRLADVGERHLLAAEAVRRVGLAGRAQAGRDFDARDVALTARMAELQDEPAVVLVHRLADRAPERDVPIVVDHRVVRHDPPAQLHRHERRDDRADTAFRELHFPVDARLVAGSVVIVETPRDVRSKEAVLDGEVLELEGLKDRFECHAWASVRALDVGRVRAIAAG